jgi:UDP-2,3-diacylglucosamine hydrolase
VKLGLLAGGGPFPRRVADAWVKQGGEVFVVCIKDFADPKLFDGYPVTVERIGGAGAIIQRLRAEGVTKVALSGRARRPSLLSILPDAWTAKAIARIGRSAFGGDDTLLKAVVNILRDEGFEVIGPSAILGGVLVDPGLLAGPEPDALARQDIARGIAVLAALSPQDVGQAVVVQQGLVLGVEATEGTDGLLARAAEQRRDGPGGVLVKLPKIGQEMRVDAPVIGPVTVKGAVAAGLRGIAIEAGGTVIADRAETLEAVAAAGLFLIAVESRGFTP